MQAVDPDVVFSRATFAIRAVWLAGRCGVYLEGADAQVLQFHSCMLLLEGLAGFSVRDALLQSSGVSLRARGGRI